MGDPVLLNTTQIVNGLAVLLSFFVGYKYGLKKNSLKDKRGIERKAAAHCNATDDGKGARAIEPVFRNLTGKYKMVLVVRNDLRMGKGKVAAQCAHGAVGAYQKAERYKPGVVRAWENTGCAKIALKVESEHEMLKIKKEAELLALNTCLIRDAGRTQIEPNTMTVLAIGPEDSGAIDFVTGYLKLL